MKRSIWEKKPSLLNSFHDWLSSLVFTLATFLLHFIANFFNFPLKTLICMTALSSLKQIFLVLHFYLTLSSLFFFFFLIKNSFELGHWNMPSPAFLSSHWNPAGPFRNLSALLSQQQGFSMETLIYIHPWVPAAVRTGVLHSSLLWLWTCSRAYSRWMVVVVC